MKPAQIAVLGIALIASVGLALVARNMMTASPEPVAAQAVVREEPKNAVLVANEKIPMGTALSTETLVWEEWPLNLIREGLITQDVEPEALETYSKYMASSTFYAGEPIRLEKIVESDSGYLSAILPSGKRAVAVRVSATSAAGGFILPNDRVDVIALRPAGAGGTAYAEAILTNVRVLAIDQVVEEVAGENARVGETATLELSPDQVNILTAASGGTGASLTLSLRSVVDAAGDATTVAGGKPRSETSRNSNVRIIRSGQVETVQIKQ